MFGVPVFYISSGLPAVIVASACVCVCVSRVRFSCHMFINLFSPWDPEFAILRFSVFIELLAGTVWVGSDCASARLFFNIGFSSLSSPLLFLMCCLPVFPSLVPGFLSQRLASAYRLLVARARPRLRPCRLLMSCARHSSLTVFPISSGIRLLYPKFVLVSLLLCVLLVHVVAWPYGRRARLCIRELLPIALLMVALAFALALFMVARACVVARIGVLVWRLMVVCSVVLLT